MILKNNFIQDGDRPFGILLEPSQPTDDVVLVIGLEFGWRLCVGLYDIVIDRPGNFVGQLDEMGGPVFHVVAFQQVGITLESPLAFTGFQVGVLGYL